MSTLRATRHVLERLAAGSGVLLALLLDLDGAVPEECDGRDAEGRAVLLVGRHQLGDSEDAAVVVARVLELLAAGETPVDVHVVAYAPAASRGLWEIASGEAAEILVDGPRGTGKTQMTPGALAALAELHARAGHGLPLKVLWLHDSLKSASAKTARSLEQAHWTGLWGLRDDRTVAVLSVGGVEMAVADFVGVGDPTARERLKAECHVVVAEEAIPSLGESTGVEESMYELALTSARLKPNRRRVGVVLTNPGAPDSWPAVRFGLEGHEGKAGCVRRAIPAADRMTAAEQAEQYEAFRNSPEQQARLARGQWVEVPLGEKVTPAFADLHIAPKALVPHPGVELFFGHDAGHTPVTIIGSRWQGSVQVYAALVSVWAGTRQHVTNLVKPWLATYAPWALTSPSLMRHWYDPSMDTGEQADIDQSPVRTMLETVGGVFLSGMMDWPGRIEPVTVLLAQFNGHTGRPVLQLCPVGCAPLIRALRSAWIYPTVNGKTSRDLPKKPNHPWEDLGDALCYFAGGIAPSVVPRVRTGKPVFARTVGAEVYGHRTRYAQTA